MNTTAAIVREGPFRRPDNAFQSAEGSIHNDAIASKIGFRGGTVPGSVHLDQFVPGIVDHFGPDWFKRGSISAYFKYATMNEEPVKAVFKPAGSQLRLEMFTEEAAQVCLGSASLDPLDPQSAAKLRRDGETPSEPSELRILDQIRVGDVAENIEVIVPRDATYQETLRRITEPMAQYDEGVLSPAMLVRLTHQVRPAVLAKARKAVGLFGALELAALEGPAFVDTPYIARTRILKLSDSPRAENVWYEVLVSDKERRADIVRAVYMIRMVKASSQEFAAT